MMISFSRRDRKLGQQKPKTSCNLLFLNCQQYERVTREIKNKLQLPQCFRPLQNSIIWEVFRPLTIIRLILLKWSIAQLLISQVLLNKIKNFNQPLITFSKYMNQVEQAKFNSKVYILIVNYYQLINQLMRYHLTVYPLYCKELIAKRSSSWSSLNLSQLITTRASTCKTI